MIGALRGPLVVRRPPLWLAAAAVASGWAALYTIGRWTLLFAVDPVHEDVRLTYVAAQAGLRYGWPTIYDQAILRSLSQSFPAGQRHIDSLYTYVNPPLLAWLFAPLTAFPEPVAYGLWTLFSLGALIAAWRIAAPYTGAAKLTLLLVSIGLWPVMLAFYFGQPTDGARLETGRVGHAQRDSQMVALAAHGQSQQVVTLAVHQSHQLGSQAQRRVAATRDDELVELRLGPALLTGEVPRIAG